MDCRGTGWRDDRCMACAGRGVLWLGGSDYMECPECSGKGYPQPRRAVFAPGTVITAQRADAQVEQIILQGATR